jgi:hypothetical protein
MQDYEVGIYLASVTLFDPHALSIFFSENATGLIIFQSLVSNFIILSLS